MSAEETQVLMPGNRHNHERPYDRPRVIVVGGGVIGVCCAYYLAKAGAAVTVIERDEVGKCASYGNAGTIAPGHPPINRPGRIGEALKSMFDPLSPLYVAPRWDPSLPRWLWAFNRSCSQSHLESSMAVLGRLGHATANLFDDLVTTEGLDCGYRRAGYAEVFLSAQGLNRAADEAELMRENGYAPQVLDAAAMRKMEPWLNDRVLGGVFHPEGATLDPYRFVQEMARRAERHGATFETGSEVVAVLMDGSQLRGVRTQAGTNISAQAIVIATGAYSADLVRRLGYRLPLQAAKGYHRDREPRPGETPPLQTACVLGERSVFCTPMDGLVRFAGTLEFSGVNHQIRPARLAQLTKAAASYLDGMGEAQTGTEWCGLRPCLPDGLPVIGPLPNAPGVWVATGHAMMGLTLGPITGRLIAEWVLGGKPSVDVEALRAERFSR